MTEVKKKFYIIDEKEARELNSRDKIFTIGWDRIPDEILDIIDDDYLYTHYYSDNDGNLLTDTIIYAKIVSRFPNGTFKANIDSKNIIGTKNDIY